MMPKEQDEYWDWVRKCLVKFHGMSVRQAQLKAYRLRQRLRTSGVGDVQYNCEAFHRAEKIVGTQLNLPIKEYREQYLRDICGFDIRGLQDAKRVDGSGQI